MMAVKKRIVKKQAPPALPKLSETEQDLLWHMEHGYQLETDSLGSNPVLRSTKDGEVIRPDSANRNTVEALQNRGLIAQAKGNDPLKIMWRPTSRSSQKLPS